MDNLEVLAQPTLPPDRELALRAHGARVHAQSRQFNAWVRQVARPTPDVTGAQLELLLEESADDAG